MLWNTVAVYLDDDERWAQYQSCIEWVSENRRQRIGRLSQDRMKVVSLFSELLVKYCISVSTGRSFRSIEFTYNAYGKPRLKNDPSVHFNVSHSGHWVLASVSSVVIGVDIERIRPRNELKLARRFFSPRENMMLAEISPKHRTRRFYELWALKESYLKWKGTGLKFPLSNIQFYWIESEGKEEADYMSSEQEECTFYSFRLGEQYAAAICTDKQRTARVRLETPPNMTQLKAQELVQEIKHKLI